MLGKAKDFAGLNDLHFFSSFVHKRTNGAGRRSRD